MAGQLPTAEFRQSSPAAAQRAADGAEVPTTSATIGNERKSAGRYESTHVTKNVSFLIQQS